MTAAVALMLLLLAPDDPASIADLEAYAEALRPAPGAQAGAVGFRDLWDHPGAHAGRRVRVEGRLARVFRQPAVGRFPALAEAWVVTPAGDPFCLVFPDAEAPAGAGLGADVRFVGTFLRRVQYRGGDAARLVPLIVGPEPPSLASPAPPATGSAGSPADWAVGLGAAAAVTLVLARRHLSRPAARPRGVEPPPRFVDGTDGPDPDGNGAADDTA